MTTSQQRREFIGTYTDVDIATAVANNELIIENFEERNIKQACYEVRASNIYYNIAEENRPKTIEVGSYAVLKPCSTIIVITKEKFKIPPNVIGRILIKGSLFSIGINAVNTYADPGFEGKLGIVLHNYSNNYIKIKENEFLVKIEFSRLHDNVKSTYKGQHGYETSIWPLRSELIMTDDEMRKDRRIIDDVNEISQSYGNKMGNIIKSIINIRKISIILCILFCCFNLVLLGNIFFLEEKPSDVLNPFVSIIIGLVTNFIFMLLQNYNSKRGT